MIQTSKRHLIEVKQGYWSHALFAWKWGLFLIFTGLLSMLHGLVPAWLPFRAPRNVMKVARLIQQRGDPREMEES